MEEQPLTGGNMGPVSLRAGEVLRPAGPWTATVQRLLRTFVEAGV